MDNKKRKILIIDDQETNREILKNILVNDYDILEAENGRDRLDILKKDREEISAVLLDIVMPVMDGYGFMNAIHDIKYDDLPIIVLTGSSGPEAEDKTLSLGAWDFISKPYQPMVLQARLKNAIARSQMEMFTRMKHLAEHDMLTGLHNRNRFFSETKKMIDGSPDTGFAIIRVDIDQFSLLNSFWGAKAGDEFLKYIAGRLEKYSADFPMSTYGRINADVFCICVPDDHRKMEAFIEKMKSDIIKYNEDYFVKPTFGICKVNDRNLSVESMYEQASMAAKTCKEKYNMYVGVYDANLKEKSFREQEIVNEMQNSLDAGEFVPYLQPKYDLKTNKPYGAEALVRWIHPVKGIISPGEFIPIFERNGFISKLDLYMWNSVCELLKKWMDAGLNPAPVSVNISRANMYNPNIAKILRDLVTSHGVPVELLNLELTESAYMDNPDIMKEIVHRLRETGFTVMMDDFGSGYSSLNTLKDIPVDVLKIDMKFLKGDDKTGRSERILSSMIRMAGWLNLPVIVEGVETKQQAEFLRSIGCGFVQGFYFARPMPVSEYEKLICNEEKSPGLPQQSENEIQMNETIWSTDPILDFLFNHVHRPLAVCEFDGNEGYPLRVNESFNEFFGYGENVMKFSGTDTFVKDREQLKVLHELLCGIGPDQPTGFTDCRIKDKNGKEHQRRILLDYLGTGNDQKVILLLFQKQ